MKTASADAQTEWKYTFELLNLVAIMTERQDDDSGMEKIEWPESEQRNGDAAEVRALFPSPPPRARHALLRFCLLCTVAKDRSKHAVPLQDFPSESEMLCECEAGHYKTRAQMSSADFS